jgi:hypothetical protein
LDVAVPGVMPIIGHLVRSSGLFLGYFVIETANRIQDAIRAIVDEFY